MFYDWHQTTEVEMTELEKRRAEKQRIQRLIRPTKILMHFECEESK